MKVSRYMTPKVVSVRSEDGIRQTYFLMREKQIRHLPVLGPDGKLVGIISDRDLRRPQWVDEDMDVSHLYQLDDNLSVGDLMTREIQAVYTYDTIRKANGCLLAHRVGALPVFNKDEQLVGMLSTVDVLQAFEDYMSAHPAK